MPPIIFVSALIFLVVLLGKKTAFLKKRGEIFVSRTEKLHENEKKGETWKKIWTSILRFLERVMFLAKIGIKKSEGSVSNVLNRMKEKRLGKKSSDSSNKRSDEKLYFESENVGHNFDVMIEKKTQENRSILKKAGFFNKEIIVKKKEEPAPQRIMPELATEDKAREEALIHRIAENPKDNEAYRELGDYYLSIGNIKDAKDSFKMVLKLRPRDLKAKSSLREIEMKMRLGS